MTTFATCPACGDADQEVGGGVEATMCPREHICTNCGARCAVEWDADLIGERWLSGCTLTQILQPDELGLES